MHGYPWRGRRIGLSVSPASRDPMHRQITDQLKALIVSGALAPQTPLPSIRDLSATLGLSQITVKRAYSDLAHEGFIVTRAGLGSFVADVGRLELRERKLKEVERELARIVRTARAFGISMTSIRRMVNEAGPR